MTRFDLSDPGVWCRRTAGLGCLVVIPLLALFPSEARAALDGEAQFVLNSFSFLIWDALVMWMCAGFTMLEAGSVRTKNASVICLKNIGLYSHHVCRRRSRQLDRVVRLSVRHVRRRDRASERPGGRRRRRRHHERQIHNVGLVLPDGVRGDDRLDRVRHPGRAGKAVVVLHLRHGADDLHLPDRRRVDLGRRMVLRHGLPGFRRLDHRPFDRRLGGACGRAGRGAAEGQVSAREAASKQRRRPTSLP